MIDWTRFPIAILSTSGGKDSQTMIPVTLEGMADQGWSGRLVVVHCDLGRAEWMGVPELAVKQAAYYGLECEVISRPQGDILTQAAKRGMWAGPATRICTADHKTAQVAKVMTREVRAWRADEKAAGRKPGRVRVANILGLRADESSKRREKLAAGSTTPNDRLSNPTMREVVDVHPIAQWTEAEVWADIKSRDVPHHFAYDLGMPRLSCCFCIFASRSVLMLAGLHNRDLLQAYVDIETEIQFQFRGAPAPEAERYSKAWESGPVALADVLRDLDAGVEPNFDALTFGDMG